MDIYTCYFCLDLLETWAMPLYTRNGDLLPEHLDVFSSTLQAHSAISYSSSQLSSPPDFNDLATPQRLHANVLKI